LNGILDVSYCKKAPIIVSAPHFYKGDALLVHSVEGLKPDARLHKAYVDIEPVSFDHCILIIYLMYKN
jgi:hypothetical protein